MSVSLANWKPEWQKDARFSRNYTHRLIEKACRLDTQLEIAYRNGTLLVAAGPHRKAGPGEGGDARWHMTIHSKAGANAWHVLLDNSVSRVIGINKRMKLGHSF